MFPTASFTREHPENNKESLSIVLFVGNKFTGKKRRKQESVMRSPFKKCRGIFFFSHGFRTVGNIAQMAVVSNVISLRFGFELTP